tara:strand:+ start:148 stop:264 length:117 start_codon:yes stop_codon:yes gene_type:complete
MHVGEPEIAAGVSIGQVFVIDAQEMKHGGVQVVNAHAI